MLLCPQYTISGSCFNVESSMVDSESDWAGVNQQRKAAKRNRAQGC
uniref:Uncharacterized protein n=1 Tax=Arundo donax TaxID=35708 RepID=A0A0A8Y2Q6_ARUDO